MLNKVINTRNHLLARVSAKQKIGQKIVGLSLKEIIFWPKGENVMACKGLRVTLSLTFSFCFAQKSAKKFFSSKARNFEKRRENSGFLKKHSYKIS